MQTAYLSWMYFNVLAKCDFALSRLCVRHFSRIEDYAEATKLPSDFVAEEAKETALAQSKWVQARAEEDFSIFRDSLARTIELTLKEADYLAYDDHPYDALLGKYSDIYGL
ncbi:MAG: hypothetical protein Q9P01_13510 [Anaerolineae bacterium]|nr:hypothetical protein [Anaerolineae bacterium]MDQ7035803.1 hypothetical protein [Anaerolineae bacterium]